MNRFEIFCRLGLGAVAVPLALLAPKLLTVEETVPPSVASVPGSALVSEQLHELLETGETIVSEVQPWAPGIQSNWQRIPLETLRRVADGAVKSFTWVWRFSNGTSSEWTEFTKLPK